MDMITLSDYKIIAGICIISFDFIITLAKLFLRNDALYHSGKIKFVSGVLMLIAQIAFVAVSVFIYNHEQLAVAYSTTIFAVAITVTFLLFWAFIQMRGISLLSTVILERLVGVIEAGDENLDGHSLHVQNLTMLIYDYLPFTSRIKINPMNLQYASLLLDIGKLGIPRSIIHKAGKLLPEEKELIQRHPEICVDIFASIPSLKTVTHWIKYHHERVDGNGYYHLKGKDIPLPARILAIADTYSAITMDRSYRPSLTHENAISELRLVAGKQLDQELVDIFCAIPKSKIADCMEDVRNRMKKYQSGSFR